MAIVCLLCRGRQRRHSTAVQLLEAGVEVNVIRALLGHVTLETTNRYAEITVRTKEIALKKLCEPPPGADRFPGQAGGAWSRPSRRGHSNRPRFRRSRVVHSQRAPAVLLLRSANRRESVTRNRITDKSSSRASGVVCGFTGVANRKQRAGITPKLLPVMIVNLLERFAISQRNEFAGIGFGFDKNAKSFTRTLQRCRERWLRELCCDFG